MTVHLANVEGTERIGGYSNELLPKLDEWKQQKDRLCVINGLSAKINTKVVNGLVAKILARI